LDANELVTDDWPASPPLQEVHVEQRGEDGPVVLAVGRSGRSHWSLSVHAESTASDLDQAAADERWPALVFDVAVRLHQRPERLGSAYRSMVAASATSGDSLELSIAPWRYGVALVEESGVTDTTALVATTPEGIIISAGDVTTDIAASTTARTVRWKYRVSCFA